MGEELLPFFYGDDQMASVNFVSLLNATASATGAQAAVSLDQGSGNFLISVVATNPVTLTSLDGAVEHSPDGTNWFQVDTITQITGATTEAIQVTDSLFPRVRFNVSGLVGTSVDLDIRLYFDPMKH